MNNDNNVLTYQNDLSDRTGQQKRTLDKYFLLIEISKVLGVFLILVIPFAVDKSLPNPTQDGQMFYLLLIGVVLVGVFTVQRTCRAVGRYGRVDFLLVFLYLYGTVHSIVLLPLLPIKYWVYLSLGVIYIYSVNFIKTNTAVAYTLIAIIMMGIGQALYGQLQLYGVMESLNFSFKMTGSFFNPGPYAGYLAMVFPAALGILLFSNQFTHAQNIDNFLNSMARLGLFFLLLSLVISNSRAAWLSTFCSAIYLLYQKYGIPVIIHKNFQGLRGRIVMLFGIGLMVLLIVGGYQYKQKSADGRLLIWSLALEMIVEAPLFGHGLDQFKAKYMEYQSEFFAVGSRGESEMIADNIVYAYNEFIHIGTEFGIVGLLLGLLLVYELFCGKIPDKRFVYEVYIARAGLLVFFVFSMFSYPFEVYPMMLVGVFYLAIISGNQKTFSVKSIVSRSYLKRGVGIVFVFCSMIGFTGLQDQKQAYQQWQKAWVLYLNKQYQVSIGMYKQAYPYLKNNGTFLLNYGKALELNEQYHAAIPILKKS